MSASKNISGVKLYFLWISVSSLRSILRYKQKDKQPWWCYEEKNNPEKSSCFICLSNQCILFPHFLL